MNKRKHSFDSYRVNKKHDTIEKVRRALDVFSNSNFKSTTVLAKKVSKVIDEINTAEYKLNVEKAKNKKTQKPVSKPKPFSYTTLLRNEDYRPLLDLHMQGNRELAPIGVTDQEILKAKCASLESQVELLQARLKSIQAGDNALALEAHDSNLLARLGDFESDQIMLVEIVEALFSDFADLFETKADGLYSPMGKKLVSSASLRRYQELRISFGLELPDGK